MGNEEDVEELRLVESVDEEDGIFGETYFLFFTANSAISREKLRKAKFISKTHQNF